MSVTRFAPSTQRSLHRRLVRSLNAAEQRSDALRADAEESVASLDLSDMIDGEANDPAAVVRGEALALAAGNDQVIVEIRMAIRRIDDGFYGVCEHCGSPVPIARLRAIPETRWCATCSHHASDGGRRLALIGP